MGASNLFKLALAALLVANVVAHPKLSESEMVDYRHHIKRTTEAIGRCLEAEPSLHAHMHEKREATLTHLRQARGIDIPKELMSRTLRPDKEALLDWEKKSHRQEGKSKDPQELFTFKWENEPQRKPSGCALAPETIYGPFWADDQPRKQDVRSGQPGIFMRLAMQVIDVNSCKPMWKSRVDYWQANAVGQYDTQLDGALRGWQPTSNHGTVDFDSIFPGHYPGRASHFHVSVRPENSDMAHVGQVYFDQDLRDAIEKTTEYAKNEDRKPLPNTEDDLATYSASTEYDPFIQYSWLGKNMEDGLVAWIVMGVNGSDTSIQQPPKPNDRRSFSNPHLNQH